MEPDFKIGDYVYACDWCYGQVVDMDEYGALVEIDTGTGGGSLWFSYSELQKAS